MKLLTSKKFELPAVYFITDRLEIKELPVGVPFIYGDASLEGPLVRMLEYEVLYQEAIRSGYPFNFKKILIDNGYKDIEDFYFGTPVYMEYTTKGISSDELDGDLTPINKDIQSFKKFIKDSVAYVDIQKLKALNVFPIWLESIEKAVHTNIHNFAMFNNNMYNKKLEGMYGSIDLVSPNRNLIIIDISGSIPKAVSSTCLALAKNLSETFYADLLITGSKSTLYFYENLNDLNIETIYEENEMDNDQVYFKKLVSTEAKIYKTAIIFGDNHSPCYKWENKFNKDTKEISREDGKKLCKWKIEKIISLHMSCSEKDSERLAGYGDWFTTDNVEHIKDWVKYLNE